MVLVNDLIVQHKKNNQYNVFVEPRRKVFQRSRKLINTHTGVISTELLKQINQKRHGMNLRLLIPSYS